MPQTPPEEPSELDTYMQVLQDLKENREGKLDRGEMHKRIRERLNKAIKAIESKQETNKKPEGVVFEPLEIVTDISGQIMTEADYDED